MFTKRTPGLLFSTILLSALFILSTPVSAANLVNVSARGEAGQGAKQMVVGFVVEGSGITEVMISGVGPTTGVPGSISNPELTVFNQETGEEVYYCDDWKNCLGASIVQGVLDSSGQSLTDSEAAASIGFDAGAYTIEIRDADGGSGIALGAATEIPEYVEPSDVSFGTWKNADGSVCFNVAALGEPRLTTDFSGCKDGVSLVFILQGKTASGEECLVSSFTTDDVPIVDGQLYWAGTAPGGSDVETFSAVFFETGFATGSATEGDLGTPLSDACIADWSARS